ncbi:MAG: serine hydrolase domain-containing protein [Bacteroidota bacterium]
MVFFKEKALLLLLLPALLFSCNKQMIDVGKTPEEKLTLIEEKFNQLEKDNQFHGAVLIAKDGAPIFEHAYGESTDGTLNKTTDQFNIASIGKMFTGVAAIKLVQDDLLDVNKTVFDYLPDYGQSADTKKMTVHHLLTHSSGIPDIFSYDKIQEVDDSKIATWYDYFSYFETDELDFEPGKKWNYSNSGYLVLGKIIEAVSGQDYCTYLTENILTKANMTSLNCGFPMGGSIGTMQDLLNFSEALQNYELLNETNTNSATEGKIRIEKDVYYGYGFQVYKRYRSLEVSHKGGAAESKAQLLMFPETGYTVIIYGNNNEIGYDGFNEARHYLREILT